MLIFEAAPYSSVPPSIIALPPPEVETGLSTTKVPPPLTDRVPLLVTMLCPVRMTRALLFPVTSITPLAWLIRVRSAPEIIPDPEMLSLTLVNVAPAPLLTISLVLLSVSVTLPLP